MSKKQKLIAKLLDANKAYKWSDLVALLSVLGFELIEGSGSRVKFDNGDPSQMINLHKPHPQKETPLMPFVRSEKSYKLTI